MDSLAGRARSALARLNLEGGDRLDVEAKTFSEYSSQALGPSLSALANLPGGGLVLLGVDERQEDSLVGLSPAVAADYARRASDQARKGFTPPVSVRAECVEVLGKTLVAIEVEEAPLSKKPCVWNKSGKAYVRVFDGDEAMSREDEQQFIRRRERPRDDIAPVPGTTIHDLDPDALASFIASVRETTPRLRNTSDIDILRLLNVLTRDGETTVAGLYALGLYPQQFLPHLFLSAAVTDQGFLTEGARSRDRQDLTGSIPDILDEALDWVARVLGATEVVTHDGRGVREYPLPLEAVREVVANALVHRDLSPATAGVPVDLRFTERGLVLTSPGGLWGISLDRLGRGRSAVNEYLYTICRHVSGRHGRVIEALGTGIRATRDALESAGLTPPVFIDDGLRFTVLFPNHALHSDDDLEWLASVFAPLELSPRQREALLLMRRGGPIANSDYRQRFGVDSATARRELMGLVNHGLAVRSGTRRGTRYSLVAQDMNPS